MDNLECKTARIEYWNKLVWLTSNSFPNSVPVNIVFKLKHIYSIISKTGIGNFFGPHNYEEISNISNGMGRAFVQNHCVPAKTWSSINQLF
jgi:hypothetical protein